MTKLLSEIKKEEIIFVDGDMNGHVGIETDGFEGIHDGNGYGKRNKEGEMLLEFATAMELVVCNTFFTKRDTKKITYASGEGESMTTSEIDYFLVRKKDSSSVKDGTVINGEECLKQHKLLICKIELSEVLPKLKRQQARDRSKGNVNQM